MTRISPEQITALTRRCDRLIDTMRAAVREPDERGHYLAVHEQLTALLVDGGAPAFGYAAGHFADAAIAATPGRDLVVRPDGTRADIDIVFTNDDFSASVPANQVGIRHQWSAQLVAARLSGDHIRYHRLVDLIPLTGSAPLSYLAALLAEVSVMLNVYEDGTEGVLTPGLYLFLNTAVPT